jgi:predicted acyl esterase
MRAGRVSRRRVLIAAALACATGALVPATASAAGFSAHGSAEQVYVTGLGAHAKMSLLNRAGHKVATKRADSLGGLLFRNVKPGKGYRVRLAKTGAKSGPLTVFSNRPKPPSTGFYNQTIPKSGYGYLTTRDGTKLAIYVHPPQDYLKALTNGQGIPPPVLPSNGTYPTLIEYAGYGYADPEGPQSGISAVANLMGFAVVDVNMRGTGCSGGAFDFFEPLQNLDGYDVIETVARQSWVANHKVGMEGISYGGISQLFTAQTRPPSLAAISPLSVIDAPQTTLYPGGILNTGFALAWTKERVHDGKPASKNGGQRWAYDRIQSGDQVCKQNQVLHGEEADLIAKVHSNNHYDPKIADPLSPITFVHKINVPVYMACQFTDEQTGGHCPTLASRFTSAPRKWFTFTNGTHVDSLDPETYNRWYDFLSLYVAHQAPIVNSPTVQSSAPVVYEAAMGISGVTLPPDPVQQQPTYAGALAMFNSYKPIRVMFDSGAGKNPGEPYPGFEQSWSRFPIPGTTARSWYLARGGALGDKPPKRKGTNFFKWNAHARSLTDFTGSTSTGDNGLWGATPSYHWNLPPGHTGLSYVSSLLKRNTVAIGAGALQLWVRSSKPNADFQVTIAEVRPDGKETFVQNGWMRGNERKLDRRKSTLLEPVPSFRKRDVRPLPSNRFVKVTIPLYYEGHVYRAGSRIRVIITAPNGDQPIWSFSQTSPKGKAKVTVAFSKKKPSRLILPVIPGVSVPTALPPCPGLRGEPCRDFKKYVNGTGR